jgi:hypothetical protein
MFPRIFVARGGRPRMLGVLALALVLTGAGLAQDPVRLRSYLPADTLIYLEVPNLGQALDALQKHPFAALLEDREVKAFLEPLMGRIEAGQAQVQEALGITVKQLLALLRGRLEVAFVGVTGVNGNTEGDWALLLDVAGHEETARQVIGRLVEMAKADGAQITPAKLGEVDCWQLDLGKRLKTYGFFAGGAFYLGTDRSRSMQIIAGRSDVANPFDRDPSLQAVAAKVKAGEAHAFYYANVAKLLALIMEEAPAGELNQDVFNKLLHRLGADDLRGLGGSLTLDARGVTEIIHVGLPAERRGLLSIYDTMRPGLTFPSRLAAGTVLYYGVKLDFLKAYDVLVDVVTGTLEDLSPAELDQVDKVLHQAESGEWGFKLREDLLASLGEEVSISVGLPRAGGFIPDVLLTTTLRDPAKFAGLLEKVEKLLPEGKVNVSRIPVEDTTLHVYKVEGSPVSPALAVAGDVLVAGVFSRSVKTFLRGYPESLAQNPVFKDGIQAIGLQDAGSTGCLMFLDVQATVRYLYETFGPMLSMVDEEDLPPGLDLALLPSTEALVRPFRPLVETMRVEPDGITVVTQGPVTLSSFQMLVLSGTLMWTTARRVEEVPAPIEVTPKPAPAEEEVVEKAEPPSPELGVRAEDVEGGGGARVIEVRDGSPAAAAGILVGDIILAVDGKDTGGVDAAAALLARKKAGEEVSLRIRRGEEQMTVRVVLKSP